MARLTGPALAGVLAAVGLTACSNANGDGTTGGGGLCAPFPKAGVTTTTTTTTTAPANGQAPIAAPPIADGSGAGVEDCLHRWGYALAHSSDDALHVANAAVSACGGAISRWNQATLASSGDAAQMAPSLMNGQQTTPLTEHYIFAQGRALFYVVQARAGKCASPAMKDGVPVGLVE